MFDPQYPRREMIGDPKLFYGREKEVSFFLQWASEIPEQKSKSRALMATKKMGKTAILERLYNILFVKKGPVIPFYFRILEKREWESEFARKFYRSFFTQYLAFKLDQPEWCEEEFPLEELKQIAEKHRLEKILKDVVNFEHLDKANNLGSLWSYAAKAPHRLAASTGDFFLQLIDEFQFLNHYFYADQNLQYKTPLAGVYLDFAESKIAPLLVTGSYIGWLRQILYKLTSRFRVMKLAPFPPEESLKAIYNYANYFNIDLGKESAPVLQKISHDHPYYISTLVRSDYDSKDLTTPEGIDEVYRFEVEEDGGEIHNHWQEYIEYAFKQTNGKLAKAIILYLSQDSKKEKTRVEILDHLKRKGITTVEDGAELDDTQLEKRLILLERSDVIAKGSTAFCYKGISDVIFNQVFQILYSHEIDNIKIQETLEAIRKKIKEDREKEGAEIYQQNKGPFLEFMAVQYLKYQTKKSGSPSLRELAENLPESASFVNYESVGGYHFNLPDGYHRQVDVLAKAAKKGDPSLLIECKNWAAPVGPQPIEVFAQKYQEVKRDIAPLIPIFYSHSGFTELALDCLKELDLAWSTHEKWPLLEKN